MEEQPELAACTPVPVDVGRFNARAKLPYGCTVDHIRLAMLDFTDFLGFVNRQLFSRDVPRLESMLMPANFSSIVGEFMSMSIPKYCGTLARNQYHNGHPDLIPSGMFPGDAVQYTREGIEIKASRYDRGWQGHNPEDTWLIVFVFDSNRPSDVVNKIQPKPFRFRLIAGAHLTKRDWRFSGRSETSRRTITASVAISGYEKMMKNWIYDDSPG